MKISQYYPDTSDQELLDFVNEVTALINEGRISIPSQSTAPSSTTNGGNGEKRVVSISTYDVRDYTNAGGTWYYSQIGRPSLAGWGYVQISGTPSSQTQSVSFGTSFDSPPFVVVSYIGVKNTSGAPSAPEDFNAANTLRIMSAFAPTTTGFTIAVYTGNASNMTNGEYEGFSWVAYFD